MLPSNDTPPPLPEFVEHLQQACEGHEMGFYFEEGGCWGMALALAEVLRTPQAWAAPDGTVPRIEDLPPVQIRARTEGFVHAFVSVGDLMIDYRGAWRDTSQGLAAAYDVAQLRALAHRFGVTEDALEADRASALAVIDTAVLWTVPAPGADAAPVLASPA